MFVMRKYELLGFFIIALISIILALTALVLPSTFLLDGLKPTTNSLWQMGKLMFMSTIIYTIIEYFIFGRRFQNFFFAKAAVLFLAPMIFIVLGYTTDVGMGFASTSNHIMAYVLGLAVGQYVSYYILRDGYYFRLMNGYAIIGILLMLTFFIGFGRIADKFDAPIFKSMESYQTYFQYR